MENIEQIIEAILFAAGRTVKLDELMLVLEINKENLINIIENMRLKFDKRGIEIVKLDDGYSLASKKEYHKYIYEILDKSKSFFIFNTHITKRFFIIYFFRYYYTIFLIVIFI